MDRLATIDRDEWVRRMRDDFARTMRQVADAVRSEGGTGSAAPERPVTRLVVHPPRRLKDLADPVAAH